MIVGKNGIGKSNLLEAINYLGTGKSFRTRNDQELVNFNSSFFHIKGEFIHQQNELSISCGFNNEKKRIKIGEKLLKTTSELFQFIKLVYFSPQDIFLISGPPAIRRAFFDLSISQYDYSYIKILRQYFRILKQRNQLLRTDSKAAEKRSWDQQFVSCAVEIINKRISYLKKFKKQLDLYVSRISDDVEQIAIKYNFSFPQNRTISIEDNFFQQIAKIKSREEEVHYSLLGPHLDDYQIDLDKQPARFYASHGQQRTIAIAFRFVQANLIHKQDSEPPILMFDDVLADLDSFRTSNILKLLENKYQIFIVTPNPDNYLEYDLDMIDLEKLL